MSWHRLKKRLHSHQVLTNAIFSKPAHPISDIVFLKTPFGSDIRELFSV